MHNNTLVLILVEFLSGLLGYTIGSLTTDKPAPEPKVIEINTGEHMRECLGQGGTFIATGKVYAIENGYFSSRKCELPAKIITY